MSTHRQFYLILQYCDYWGDKCLDDVIDAEVMSTIVGVNHGEDAHGRTRKLPTADTGEEAWGKPTSAMPVTAGLALSQSPPTKTHYHVNQLH